MRKYSLGMVTSFLVLAEGVLLQLDICVCVFVYTHTHTHNVGMHFHMHMSQYRKSMTTTSSPFSKINVTPEVGYINFKACGIYLCYHQIKVYVQARVNIFSKNLGVTSKF